MITSITLVFINDVQFFRDHVHNRNPKSLFFFIPKPLGDN